MEIDSEKKDMKMWVASLKIEDLKKIKAQLEAKDGKNFDNVMFDWGVTEYDALMIRIIEEVGESETLLKIQRNIREWKK